MYRKSQELEKYKCKKEYYKLFEVTLHDDKGRLYFQIWKLEITSAGNSEALQW